MTAAVRTAASGPLLMFVEASPSRTPFPIYRVEHLAPALEHLRSRGARIATELAIPPGPCVTLTVAGALLGVYEPGATERDG
jgi:hypothetical protein